MIRRIDVNKSHERKLFETHFIPETRLKDYQDKSIKEFIDSRLEHFNGLNPTSSGLLDKLRQDIININYPNEKEFLNIIYQNVTSLDAKLRDLDGLLKTNAKPLKIKFEVARVLKAENEIRQKFKELIDYRITNYMNELYTISDTYEHVGYEFPKPVLDNLVNLAHKYANSRSSVFKEFRKDTYEIIKGSVSLHKVDPERLDKQFEFLEEKYDLLTGITKM